MLTMFCSCASRVDPTHTCSFRMKMKMKMNVEMGVADKFFKRRESYKGHEKRFSL